MESRDYRLTDRQRRILRFIWEFSDDRGYPPSIREIGEAVGISSTSVVNYNLEKLEREDLIERDRRQSRGLRLSEIGASLFATRSEGMLSIPILGMIAAGEPIPVPASDFGVMAPEDTVELAEGILGKTSDLFALRVKGNSMIDALINDGDVVIMKHQKVAENGDMVAVWLPDKEETTLKKYYHEGDRVRLQPANPTMEPIYVNPANVEIQGRVVMVIRQLRAA